MPCRDDLELKVCTSVFKDVGACVPVYAWGQGQVGQRYWHDQRYLCAAAGVSNLYAFRKQEKTRDIMTRVRYDCSLSHHDAMKNVDGGRHLPLLLSSLACVGWLGERYVMAVHAGQRAEPGYLRNWQALVDGIQISCCSVLQSGTLQDVPSFSADGVDLSIGAHGMVDLHPLVCQIPS